MRLSRLIIVAQAQLRKCGDGELSLHVEHEDDCENCETFRLVNFEFDSTIKEGEHCHCLISKFQLDGQEELEPYDPSPDAERKAVSYDHLSWSNAYLTKIEENDPLEKENDKTDKQATCPDQKKDKREREGEEGNGKAKQRKKVKND